MSKSKQDIERIGQVVRYIDQHLEQDLLLEDLAAIAYYSPFHFQRIFKSIIGETPKQYIKRLRLEKAAHLIVLYPDRSIMEVALDAGFNSLEAFSRAFKDYYDLSPDHFRKSDEKEKLGIVQRTEYKESYIKLQSILATGSTDEALTDVEVIKRPSQKIAYLQTTLDPAENIASQFLKLRNYAESRDLLNPGAEMFGIIKDFPIFTPLPKCRYQVCIEVNKIIQLSGNVGYMEIPSAKYASFKVQGDISAIVKKCTQFAHNWIPESGYKIVNKFTLQVPLKDPLTTPFDQNEYRLYIKVEAE